MGKRAVFSRTGMLGAVFCIAVALPALAFDPPPPRAPDQRDAARPSSDVAFPASGAQKPATGPADSGALPPGEALREALRRLEASNAVWKANDSDFRAQREAGRIAGAEAEEFATYVAELKLQVLKDCERVRRLGGERELEKYDCRLPETETAAGGGSSEAGPAGTAGNPADQAAELPPPPESAPTAGEAADSLDQALRRIEGELDDLARTEAETARQRTASIPAGGGGVTGGSAGRNGSSGAERGADGQGGQSGVNGKDGSGAASRGGEGAEKEADRAGSGNRSDGPQDGSDGASDGARMPSANNEGTPEEPGAGPGKPEEKKSAKADRTPGEAGTDDDVLARQLREAAENEQDPVLKEKLWAEYRKYKDSQR